MELVAGLKNVTVGKVETAMDKKAMIVRFERE